MTRHLHMTKPEHLEKRGRNGLDPKVYLPRQYSWMPYPTGTLKWIGEDLNPLLYAMLARCCGNPAEVNTKDPGSVGEWNTYLVHSHCTVWLYVGRFIMRGRRQIFEFDSAWMADC